MALITCPECGRKISDKATACPHCGCPVAGYITCPECGKQVPETAITCPNCGFPFASNEESICEGRSEELNNMIKKDDERIENNRLVDGEKTENIKEQTENEENAQKKRERLIKIIGYSFLVAILSIAIFTGYKKGAGERKNATPSHTTSSSSNITKKKLSQDIERSIVSE